MDAWGYSFRLGTTQRWIEQDAEDARACSLAEQHISIYDQPTWRVRE